MNEASRAIETPAAPGWAGAFDALLTTETRAFFCNGRSLVWTALVPLLVLFLGYLDVRGHAHGPATSFTIAAVALTIVVFALGLFGYATILAT